MKHESLFSAGGLYEFVVTNNVLLHREATEKFIEILKKWIAENSGKNEINILDLACGGTPLIVANAMATFANINFRYVGVDINADQVARAQAFRFSANVKSTILEANAFDPSSFGLKPSPDIVFIGLNSHHATPEELFFFFKKLKSVLSPRGVFVNHDVFRPERYPYLRRPDHDAAGEDMRLVNSETLGPIDPVIYGLLNNSPATHDWRKDFADTDTKYLRSLGATDSVVNANIGHLMARDYPVSIAEMQAVLFRAGFSATGSTYTATENPVAEYLGMVTAKSMDVSSDLLREGGTKK